MFPDFIFYFYVVKYRKTYITKAGDTYEMDEGRHNPVPTRKTIRGYVDDSSYPI